jgi:hypothetical protein
LGDAADHAPWDIPQQHLTHGVMLGEWFEDAQPTTIWAPLVGVIRSKS